MTLATDEFIRRFLMHVLPKGLHRIRHCGLFANGNCRACLGLSRASSSHLTHRWREMDSNLVWGFFCQVMFLVCWRFFVRSGKAVLRPVAYNQVRGARGRGQGTETVAELSGLPLSRACVWQRLDA